MKRMLPRSLDDVSGMRAARWFRESTAGQWDNFGPDAQREQQDRAIERYGLLDAGLEWSVASSGWTSAWRTTTWEAMIGSATAGCLRRPRRRLRLPLPAQPQADAHRGRGPPPCRGRRRALRRRAAALSSDPGSWDQFIREAHEAEAYSRKLCKRVSEGYAAKRRRLGVPGGNRMPYGLIREGKPSVLRGRRGEGAGRHPCLPAGRHRARPTGRWRPRPASPRPTSSEVLTNPIYAGQAADRRGRGHRAHRRPGALVDRADDAGATADPDTGSHREGRLRPAPLLCGLREVPLRRRRPLSASAADLRGASWRRSPSSDVGGAVPGADATPASRATATRRSGTRTPSVSCSARSGASTTTP